MTAGPIGSASAEGMPSMSPFVVAIACSAGGLHALQAVLSALPADFPGAVIVLQHLSRSHHSYLPEILERRTTLKVKQAARSDAPAAGHVYVCPPDRHLVFAPSGVLMLNSDRLINFVRPSADVMFQSLADVFKRRGIAVVLTGNGHDGAAGVSLVKARGGCVIAQDETTSEYFGMPGSAIRTGSVDFILPLHEISPKLLELAAGLERQP